MCAAPTPPLRDITPAHSNATRTRLVIDPIWKVIDVAAYSRTWETVMREAVLYGFVGFDLEWTTKLLGRDTGDCTTDAQQAFTSSAKLKPRRWTGPVATIQLSTFSCTVVVRWNHLHALVSGNASELLRDPYATVSSGWPSYRLGQKRNCSSVLRRIYSDVKGLITDSNIYLVGVGIHGDEVKLRRDYPKVIAKSAVDLTALAEACLPEVVVDRSLSPTGAGPREVRTDSLQSLKKLCAALTGKELGKDMFVIMSDWGGCHGALTSLQIEYSAEDAEASYDVCIAILKGGGFLHDRPRAAIGGDRPASSDPWCVANGLDCREVLACCTTNAAEEVRDVSLAAEGEATVKLVTSSRSDLSSSAAENTEGTADTGWCKGRAKPYYDNINVYSPDMQLVFTVDKAKADWYVNKKGLATVVEWRQTISDSPSVEGAASDLAGAGEREIAAIRLSFAPDFARYNDAHIRRNLEYFKQPKENICVACGEGGALVRFAVVPLMYRRFFPSVYMSHNSYDLLLLCPHCFAKSRRLYEQLRLSVAEDFGIPLIHLRGAQRDAYAEEVRGVAERIEASTRVYMASHGDGDAELNGAPGRDCDIHPRLRLQGMSDYLTLVGHREVLDKVFSYAKALHAHYQSRSQRGEGAGASGGGESVVDVAQPQAPPLGNKKTQRRGWHAAGSRADKVTSIPDERRRMMADFLCAHAPHYPFYAEHVLSVTDGEQRVAAAASGERLDGQSGSALQNAVFSDTRAGPASPVGVSFILTGCTHEQQVLRGPGDAQDSTPALRNSCVSPEFPPHNNNTSRGVLTRYWVSTHPELVASLPTMTRAEERQRVTCGETEAEAAEGGAGASDHHVADALSDSEAADVPYVDSHAFHVVQQLLRKYGGGGSCRKTAEHAVGQFIYRWRSSFVEGMKPRFLPRGWVPEDGILR